MSGEQDPDECGVGENPDPEDELDLPGPNPEPEDESNLPNTQPEDEMNPPDANPEPEVNQSEHPNPEAECEASSPPHPLNEGACSNEQSQQGTSEKKKKKKKKKKKSSQGEPHEGGDPPAASGGGAEADVFEPEDALAAPECEAGEQRASCSESDQLMPVGQSQPSQPCGMSLQEELQLADANTPGPAPAQQEEPAEDSQHPAAESEASHHFNGDVEVVNSPEDAPEAEIGAGIVEACEEDTNIPVAVDGDEESSRGNINDRASVEAEQELPAPECDRPVQPVTENDGAAAGEAAPSVAVDQINVDTSQPPADSVSGNQSDPSNNSGAAGDNDAIPFADPLQANSVDKSEPCNNTGAGNESVNKDPIPFIDPLQVYNSIPCSQTLGNSSSDSTGTSTPVKTKVVSNGDIKDAGQSEQQTTDVSDVSVNGANSENGRTSEKENVNSSPSIGNSNSASPARNGIDAASSHTEDMEGEVYQKKLAEALRIHDDEEDELMTQLNAELLSQSPKPNEKEKKDKDSPESKASPQVLNGQTSELQLNRQLIDQLQIRDTEIKR